MHRGHVLGPAESTGWEQKSELHLEHWIQEVTACRVRAVMYGQIPLELLCSIPQLLAFILGLPVNVVALCEFIRVIRVTRLLKYFSQRQEDLSADVRWIAGCKFIFIIFATAHWIGCVMFFFVAEASASPSVLAIWLLEKCCRKVIMICVGHILTFDAMFRVLRVGTQYQLGQRLGGAGECAV